MKHRNAAGSTSIERHPASWCLTHKEMLNPVPLSITTAFRASAVWWVLRMSLIFGTRCRQSSRGAQAFFWSVAELESENPGKSKRNIHKFHGYSLSMTCRWVGERSQVKPFGPLSRDHASSPCRRMTFEARRNAAYVRLFWTLPMWYSWLHIWLV